MHGDGTQMQVPMVPGPMAFFGMFVAFMIGMMIGMKKSMAMRDTGMGMHGMPGMGMHGMSGMGMPGKMGMHHHHGYGMPACGCGPSAQSEPQGEQDRPEGGG